MYIQSRYPFFFFFFFNDTATTEIYTLSLHDALPISRRTCRSSPASASRSAPITETRLAKYAVTTATATKTDSCKPDRKSTRLNSSHGYISYAVFCLKKKKNRKMSTRQILQAAQS